MKIKVTQKDIERGRPMTPAQCPIAMALRRKFPQSNIMVGYEILEIDGKIYWVTNEMADFICDYDKGIAVKPFTFNLNELVKVIDQ